MKKRTIKKFYGLVKEDTKRLSFDSIDDQIDSLLLNYQSGSTVSESKKLRSLLAILLEAPGDEEEEEEGMGLAGEEGAEAEPALPGEEEVPDQVQGSEEVGGEEGVVANSPKIDLDMYTQSVVNLLDNYDKLLDMRTVIVNRSMNILRQNYGDDVIEEFENILDAEFGISLHRDTNEVPEAPLGGNAGPSIG